MHIEITQIHTITSEIELLLTEHRRALGTDINIHNQNEEISMLYTAPRGTLYVAKANNQIAGCITITRLTEYNCELGNLYIRPNYQGLDDYIKNGILQMILRYFKYQRREQYR